MGEVPDIYLTGPLTKEQLLQAVTSLCSFLRDHSKETIVHAEYGFGCKLHPALCYRDMDVGVGWLDRFIADSLRQEIVALGHSDFYISIPKNRLTVLFCHEGDIHVRGSDLEIQKALWLHKPFDEFPLIRAPHLPEPPQTKKSWF